MLLEAAAHRAGPLWDLASPKCAPRAAASPWGQLAANGKVQGSAPCLRQSAHRSAAQAPSTGEHPAAEGPLGLPDPLGGCEGPGEKGTGAQASATGPGQKATFHCDQSPNLPVSLVPTCRGADHQTEGESVAF